MGWAHHRRQRYPDGQLFADLRGYAPDRPVSPAAVLGRFLRALGLPPDGIPSDMECAVAFYRSLMADRRILLVLDNVADADQVRPLLPASSGCLVLMTSRDRLTGLVARDGARRVGLGGLEPCDSVALLTGLLGEVRTAGQLPAVRALAEWCGHLPLALRIAAANLMERSGQPLGAYVRQLRVRDRLSAFEVPGDSRTGVRSALDLSYAHLPSAAQRMFRLLGRSSRPELDAEDAAALSRSSPDEARNLLEELVGRHLLMRPRAGRYRLHELVREYARQLAEGDDQALALPYAALPSPSPAQQGAPAQRRAVRRGARS